jgi:hypothetical protein
VSNTLVSIDMITREALRIAHEQCQFIGTVDRQYDSSFAQTGAKIGTTLRVRKPNQYVRTTGSRVMDVQDQNESKIDVTVATQDHVDMRFNSAELALTLDDISKRYIEPAVKVLVSGIESDFLAYATKATPNLVGTDNTAITTLDVPGKARARLNQFLAPKSDRSVQMDSMTMAGLVNGMAAYFAPQAAISEQYKEGLVARTSMADYYENERVWNLANATDVAFTLNSFTVTEGCTTYTVSNWATPNVGMVVQFTGINAVHPETKADLGFAKTFTVVAGSTATSMVLSPPLYSSASGALQNVVSLPTTSNAVTAWGTASKTYVNPLMYHKEAFTFVTADLPLMDDAAKCVRRTQDGLSLRVWQASDIRNDELLMRIDILYGMAALRPEWACRMAGLYQ